MTSKPAAPRRSLIAVIGAAAAATVIALTGGFEGTVLTTYKDVGGVLTYCTGATENAQFGKAYTPAECKEQLDRDLARHAEGVMNCIHVPMTDGQRIAYVDFAYNEGVYRFCNSSMARLTNAGRPMEGCAILPQYNKAGGRIYAGLTRRRAIEQEFCKGKRK